MDVVLRRVLGQDGTRRDLDVRLDELEDRPLARSVGLPLQQAPLDVVVAAEGEEVVLFVVIQRRLVPQPAPDRVGVGVDLEVVGVVVDVAAVGDGHWCRSLFIAPVAGPDRPRGRGRPAWQWGWPGSGAPPPDTPRLSSSRWRTGGAGGRAGGPVGGRGGPVRGRGGPA